MSEFDERVIGELCMCKLLLNQIQWVCHSQNTMSKARNHFAGSQCVLCKLCQQLHGWLLATEGLLCFFQPTQTLLIRKSMKRTGKSIDSCGERKVRIAQCTTDKVSSMCRHISTLVVGVQHQIQTRNISET